MTFYLRFGNLQLNDQQLYDALVQYGLLDPLLERLFLDFEVLPSISVTDTDIFERLTGLNRTEAPVESQAFEAFLLEQAQQYDVSVSVLKSKAIREIQMSKLKQQFEPYIESSFLQSKSSYDQVEFSLIQTSNIELAQEILFLIRDDGFNFHDFAAQHSEGAERNSGGKVGPIAVSSLPDAIASVFHSRRTGEIYGPITIGSQHCIVRLERFYSASLTEALRSEIRTALFARWLSAQVRAIPHQIVRAEPSIASVPQLTKGTNSVDVTAIEST